MKQAAAFDSTASLALAGAIDSDELRSGWQVNHKRSYRLYRPKHLAVRRLKRKRLIRAAFTIVP